MGQCKYFIDNILGHFSIKVLISAIMCAHQWLFGPDSTTVIAVYLLILLDTISGTLCAMKQCQIESKAFFRVAVKCFIYFILIATGRLVDMVTPIKIASSIMDSFLAMTEAISIMENLHRIGFPVPTKLVKILKEFKDK